MPRPISWLPRVGELHRSVVNSVRSHYERCDLEQLFQLQPRAAQKLIEILPRTGVGSTLVVTKDHLGEFLDRVRKADDPGKLIEELRADPPPVTRQKMRATLRWDARIGMDGTLPRSVHLRRGRLEVGFRTVRDLAEGMWALAQLLRDRLDEFEDKYAVDRLDRPSEKAEPDPVVEEVQAMFAELERMEIARGAEAVHFPVPAHEMPADGPKLLKDWCERGDLNP